MPRYCSEHSQLVWDRALTPATQLALAALAAVLLGLCFVPLGWQAEAWLGYLVLAAMWFSQRYANRWPVRVLYLALAVFLSFRYFAWRTANTLHWHGPLSYFAALSLYLAELYGLLLSLLGMFTNLSPARREPSPPVGPPEAWPTVDVMIPTYNEGVELLEITLLAACQLRYAPGKVSIYLCDDGGTRQRTENADPQVAEPARARQVALRALCAELGVTYLTRDRNEHSKAGNLNAALGRSSGDLILILDADH
ncbi:MAG: glycosyltransferase, partial [Cyanobacteria bacterium REEB65]|nr:glycosyltransferase [Cyanobacteria bacterium REEB65]